MRDHNNQWRGPARGRPRTRGASRSRVATGRAVLSTAFLSLILAGCTLSLPWDVHSPTALRSPTLASVIESETLLSSGHTRYGLANGQTFEVDYTKTQNLEGGPAVGWLLLAGTDPDGRAWVAGFIVAGWIHTSPPCYQLVGRGRDGGDVIATASGFLLPKAPDFEDHSGDLDPDYGYPRGVFCLDDHGLVTSYEPG